VNSNSRSRIPASSTCFSHKSVDQNKLYFYRSSTTFIFGDFQVSWQFVELRKFENRFTDLKLNRATSTPHQSALARQRLLCHESSCALASVRRPGNIAVDHGRTLYTPPGIPSYTARRWAGDACASHAPGRGEDTVALPRACARPGRRGAVLRRGKLGA
jgi:hypothetical protein